MHGFKLLFATTVIIGSIALPAVSATPDVVVTKDPAAVAACAYLDVLHSHPPYILPGADIRQMKKRAAELGADTILVVTRSVVSEGKAYKCKQAAASTPASSTP